MTYSNDFLAEVKAKLIEEKDRLEKELSRFAKANETEGSYTTTFQDMGSDEDEQASEVEQYVDDIALESNLEAQLKDVLDALVKIETGNYGVCEETGEMISEERLRVYPQARTVVKA
jgi:RNA polymerase-binding transcription factor DksA